MTIRNDATVVIFTSEELKTVLEQEEKEAEKPPLR